MAKFIPNWNCHYWVSQKTELTQSKTPPTAITDSIILSKGIWSIKAFWLVQAINMTPKRSAIALRLPSEAGPRSRFRLESNDVFNFSHGKAPNLMVFSVISFWNEKRKCLLLRNCKWFSSCKPRESQATRDFARMLRDTCCPYVLQATKWVKPQL